MGGQVRFVPSAQGEDGNEAQLHRWRSRMHTGCFGGHSHKTQVHSRRLVWFSCEVYTISHATISEVGNQGFDLHTLWLCPHQAKYSRSPSPQRHITLPLATRCRMDPLSLLAGIAGVATAGIQVSKAIYDLVLTIRGTPKEISDIARGVSDLSMVLGALRRALKGSKLYRRKLLRRVRSAIRRIDQIHVQIRDMISEVNRFASLKWLFRRSKTTHLLYQIESLKNGINMILHIMTLAAQTRMLAG